MSCLPFGRHCSRSTERGCHVACALIGMYCNTNCAAASHNRGCNVANGYSVLESTKKFLIFPILYSYHGTHVMCDNWNELSHLACATV